MFDWIFCRDIPFSINGSEIIPNIAGSNDIFRSLPSRNMPIATMMFSLPMFSDVCFGRLSDSLVR